MNKLFLICALMLVFTASAIAQDGPSTWMAKKAYDIYVSGYIQPRFTYVDGGDPESAFAMKRARLKVNGALNDVWGFVLQAEFAGTASLRTVGLTANVGDGQLGVGQLKVPFTLEGLASSSKLDTINRAAIVGTVDDRDLGVFLDYPVAEGKVTLQAAVTNGTGTNAAETNDEKDLWVRVVAQPLQGSEGPADTLLIGAAYNTGDQQELDAAGVVDLGDFTRARWAGTAQWTYDAIKLQGEYVNSEQDLAAGGSTETKGWYVLASYDLPVDSMTVTPVVKFEDLDPDAGGGGSWTTLGVAFRFVGTNDVKLEVNYVLEDLDVGMDADELLLQLTAKY